MKEQGDFEINKTLIIVKEVEIEISIEIQWEC